MSRKNLSRTVIEGGRYHRNQYQRRHSSRAERATTRTWLDRVDVDPEEAEYSAPPERERVSRQFYDKLAPAKRWLASQVGRPWNKVYQDLCTTFDRKTIAGNHVVEHILDWVQIGIALQHTFSRRSDFIVDAHGILRRGELYGQSLAKLRKAVFVWTQGRRAMKASGIWWVRVSGSGEACVAHPCHERHYALVDGTTYLARYHELAYTTLTAFSEGDKRRLARVPVELRWSSSLE